MRTEEFILEVTKLMTTVLTGFLVIVASAIGGRWSSKTPPSNCDYAWVTAISALGLLSFGCWAGALAGAMISTTKEGGTILLWHLSSTEALVAARHYVAWAYSFFVFTVIFSGIYYLNLLRRGFKTR